MPSDELSVILRIPEQVGISYWCLKVHEGGGRPDIAPERPWEEMREGDRVVASDGTVYELDRLARADAEPQSGAPQALLPECRAWLERPEVTRAWVSRPR